MSPDKPGATAGSSLEVIDPEECLKLLAAQPVGRLGYCIRGAPHIEPVNFAVHDGDVVVNFATGTKLAAAARDALFTLEVDDIDPQARTGWSVTVTGPAAWVESEERKARLGEVVRPWAPGDKPYFMLIKPERVSGRRIVRGTGTQSR
jgi:nitroimidazol reductase NimA-like FMN-containing flavoprotein (pyridoxamine 5'-phosphate oxidase superfamily)